MNVKVLDVGMKMVAKAEYRRDSSELSTLGNSEYGVRWLI